MKRNTNPFHNVRHNHFLTDHNVLRSSPELLNSGGLPQMPSHTIFNPAVPCTSAWNTDNTNPDRRTKPKLDATLNEFQLRLGPCRGRKKLADKAFSRRTQTLAPLNREFLAPKFEAAAVKTNRPPLHFDVCR
ncbi:unnamed protein product [Cuscuta epithymum]|uniref:Uncharacterized protein n=1 Tax=Cuscuta epithymum TaxID=186058 RepID=A0AAV0CKH0_9ASTE|nr:unnamed protein product [Cuscuta epithymum]